MKNDSSIPAKPNPARQQIFWSWQAKASPYLFLLPFIFIFTVFMLYPLLRSMMLSFYNFAGPRRSIFVGWNNYGFLFRDWLFWLAVKNTLLYTITFLSLQIPISLVLALLLNSPSLRFRKFFRFAFFTPYLVGNVFVAVMFILLLYPRQGLINRMIGGLFPWAGSEFNWRGSSTLAMPALVLASLWITVGYGMIYFLAALQAVDHELYEAAEMDGAGRLGKFWHVTLPGIRPVLLFVLLVGTIGSLQLFELPYVFFDPPTGPGLSGITIVMYLYQQGFEFGNIGYAAAIGWVLVLMIFLASMAQLRITGALKEV